MLSKCFRHHRASVAATLIKYHQRQLSTMVVDRKPSKKAKKPSPDGMKQQTKLVVPSKASTSSNAFKSPAADHLPQMASAHHKRRLRVDAHNRARLSEEEDAEDTFYCDPIRTSARSSRLRQAMWVYDVEAERMTNREITFVPGLYKIFDGILVNAADNKQRDAKMTCIKIDIDADANRISVMNDGRRGIPVVMHKEQKIYVPTMIFGSLLTSSNFNDEDRKVTGGRNGYGAKLCNIFSTRLQVETCCKGKRLKQTWSDNMSSLSEPKIGDHTGKDFTRITFEPDLR